MMRTLASIVLVGILSFVARLSHAADERPLLTRHDMPGFVIPGSAPTQKCALYGDRVVITRILGDVVSEETRAIAIKGDIMMAIAAAEEGEISEEIAPVDMPIKIYSAYLHTDDGSARRVDLGSRQNGATTFNNAPEARGLKSFLDAHCS